MEDIEQTAEPKKRHRPRFSLKALLFLALLVACSLAAFRVGQQQGFDKGQSLGFAAGYADGRDNKVFPVTYRVSDLVLPIPPGKGPFAKFQELIKEVETEVHPASWEAVDGPATMAPYPQNLALVISHTVHGHDVVRAFLEQKRKGKAAPAPKTSAPKTSASKTSASSGAK